MTPPGIQQDFGVCTVCISCSSEAVYLFTNHSNQKDVRSFHVHTLFIDASCAAVHPCPGSFVSRDARQPFPQGFAPQHDVGHSLGPLDSPRLRRKDCAQNHGPWEVRLANTLERGLCQAQVLTPAHLLQFMVLTFSEEFFVSGKGLL